MDIQLNGKSTPISQPCSVAELLAELGLANKRVAVEINGEIVPRSQQTERMIAPNDNVEIVVAVGGG